MEYSYTYSWSIMITDISRCSPKTNPWGSDTSCPPEYNGSSSKDLYFLKRCHLFIYLYRYCVCFFPYIFPYTLNNSLQKTLNNLRKVLSVFLSFRRLFLTNYHRFRHPLRFKSLSLRQETTAFARRLSFLFYY